jgi:hypothetical protein
MKKLLFIVCVAFIFASCNKCVGCSKEGNSTIVLCRYDYDSNDEYNDAIAEWESKGRECK